jgi:YesN/AraC family two-component response regulator
MLKMMVKKASIEDIDTAQNGFDGFNMVIEKQYDFIICDLNMPVMDGFECVQKIKEHYDDNNSFFKQ